MTKSFVKEVETLSVSIELIKLGARPPVVDALTGIGQERAVRLYREMTGRTPPKGQLPSLGRWYVKSVNANHASYFYHVYDDIVSKSKSTGVDSLIAAYRVYKEYKWTDDCEGLSFDRAWWLVRLVQIGSLVKVKCITCNSQSVLEPTESHSRHICQFCRSRQRRHAIKSPRKDKLVFSQIYPDGPIVQEPPKKKRNPRTPRKPAE